MLNFYGVYGFNSSTDLLCLDYIEGIYGGESDF